MDVFLGQRHGRIKADDWEVARHMQDDLYHRLAHNGIAVIELSSIIPWEGSAVIAMIDIAQIPRLQIAALKDDCCIGSVVVVVFEIYANA